MLALFIVQLGIVGFLFAIYRTEREEARAVERALIHNRAVRRAYFRGHGDGYDLGFVRGFEAGTITTLARAKS